ncbi:FGGY family carbohydrate kinase [Micromonospora yangpuensis]|uniref:Xylulokinase n=1 Tax=Micromonospora yangpuensis TaxID=683228 RepID=A0A1C6U4H0_9ACTN|nr:FGGY family carbohydrate kinase [Micromonospora yangpuensis]GGL92650.1 xylulokinase [Micromonospora yangpuensis]SCL48917.1 xylulokinase [Micromonospora yangpuensis]
MVSRTLVAGIDSSTQSCKVEVRDLRTGRLVRAGRAAHPPQKIIDPYEWWKALLLAVDRAGGLHDVSALSVSGQQHTPVFLDADGAVVCDSPLWNDNGSHPQVVALNDELGFREWIRRTGLPISLSDTVVKLRWLRDTDPDSARRTAAVAVVHDWLTWLLMGHGPGRADFSRLVTDRSEASGTGYWSGETGDYCTDLVQHAFGKQVILPRVLGPLDRAGVTGTGITGIPAGLPIGAGSGDNAAAALALRLQVGDAVMSLGTSGVVYSRSTRPVHDYSGVVCSYADATGDHLPLAATLNAARDLDAGIALLGCDYSELSALALQAPPGAGGLTMLPYFEGERTPDLPDATASLHGATLANFTRPNFARAVVEGMLASQVVMIDATRACGVPVNQLLLIGGAARSTAVQTVLAQIIDVPLLIPEPGEYVAIGAAAQAGGALTGTIPDWQPTVREVPATPTEAVIMNQHRAARSAMSYDAALTPA